MHCTLWCVAKSCTLHVRKPLTQQNSIPGFYKTDANDEFSIVRKFYTTFQCDGKIYEKFT